METDVRHQVDRIEAYHRQSDTNLADDALLHDRMRFCEMLFDPNIELWEIEKEATRLLRSSKLVLDQKTLTGARHEALSGKIFIGRTEPTEILIYLLYSVYCLRNECGEFDDIKLIISSDLRKQPSGSAQKVNESCFKITLARFLILDAFYLSAKFYATIWNIRKAKECSFSEAMTSENFLSEFLKSNNQHELSLMLASTFLGEKLRYLAFLPRSVLDRKGKYTAHLCVCMIVFLIGHELTHILRNHHEDKRSGAATEISRLTAASILEDLTKPSSSPNYNNQEFQNLISEYKNSRLEDHLLEFDADFFAHMLALNVSVELFGSKFPGVVAALSMLAITRSVDTYRYRPLLEAGRSAHPFNDVELEEAFISDILIPHETHPTGQTRYRLFQKLYLAHNRVHVYRGNQDGYIADCRSFMPIYESIDLLFSRCIVEAIKLADETQKVKGECSIACLDDSYMIIEHSAGKEANHYITPLDDLGFCSWKKISESAFADKFEASLANIGGSSNA